MNFLGIGPAELLLIVVLALIVLGPEKLPQVMAQVGRAIDEFRRATSQLSDEFNRTIQAELNETRSAVAESKETLKEARSTLNDAVAGTATTTKGDARVLPTAAALPASADEPQPSAVTVESATGRDLPADAGVLAPAQWTWETGAAAPSPLPSTSADKVETGQSAPDEVTGTSPIAPALLGAGAATRATPSANGRDRRQSRPPGDLLPPY